MHVHARTYMHTHSCTCTRTTDMHTRIQILHLPQETSVYMGSRFFCLCPIYHYRKPQSIRICFTQELLKGSQLGFSYSPEKTLWMGPLIQQMCKDLLVLALKCSVQIAGSANFGGAHVPHPTGNDKPCVLGGQPEAWKNDHHPQGTGFASTPGVFGYLLSSPQLRFLCCRDCLFVG